MNAIRHGARVPRRGAELRKLGFRDYEWQQWHSGEITIAVVSTLEGVVVCRYSSPGQSRNWTQQIWSFIRRAF